MQQCFFLLHTPHKRSSSTLFRSAAANAQLTDREPVTMSLILGVAQEHRCSQWVRHGTAQTWQQIAIHQILMVQFGLFYQLHCSVEPLAIKKHQVFSHCIHVKWHSDVSLRSNWVIVLKKYQIFPFCHSALEELASPSPHPSSAKHRSAQ